MRSGDVRKEDAFVGIWMLVTVLLFSLNFLYLNSVPASYAITFSMYGVGVGYARYSGRGRHLLIAGTVAGAVELLADHFLVAVAGSLVYPSGYPAILSSPLYMPFIWAVLIVFMGYLAIRLGETYGTKSAYIGPAAFALVSESVFESIASNGGGWRYVAAPIGWVGHAPLFLLVAEAVMFGTIYFWMKRSTSLRAGLGFGATITASYIGSYYLFVLFAAMPLG